MCALRYCILKIWGIRVTFGCERSCSSHRRVSNSNSKVPQGVGSHIKFERYQLNTFRVRVFTSSGSTGGRGDDAKTIISPNTSFGDIIHVLILILCKLQTLKIKCGQLNFTTYFVNWNLSCH